MEDLQAQIECLKGFLKNKDFPHNPSEALIQLKTCEYNGNAVKNTIGKLDVSMKEEIKHDTEFLILSVQVKYSQRKLEDWTETFKNMTHVTDLLKQQGSCQKLLKAAINIERNWTDQITKQLQEIGQEYAEDVNSLIPRIVNMKILVSTDKRPDISEDSKECVEASLTEMLGLDCDSLYDRKSQIQKALQINQQCKKSSESLKKQFSSITSEFTSLDRSLRLYESVFDSKANVMALPLELRSLLTKFLDIALDCNIISKEAKRMHSSKTKQLEKDVYKQFELQAGVLFFNDPEAFVKGVKKLVK